MINKKYLFVLFFGLFILFVSFTNFFNFESNYSEDNSNHSVGPQINLSGYNNSSLVIISLTGLILTIICAIFLERNVSRVASKSGRSIGTAIMGISSSLPLLIIAITLAIENRADLIVINVIGANIANLTLVLGILSFVKPIKRGKSFSRGILALIVLLISIGTIFVTFKNNFNIEFDSVFVLDLMDGYFLIGLFFIFILLLNFFKSQNEHHLESKNLKLEIFLSVIFGLAVSWFASTTVRSFIVIAENYLVPAIIIGSVIGVIGASLPELAIGLVCLVKKEDEAIFSNLITSTIVNFNLGFGLAVLFVGQIVFDYISIALKIPFMLFVTLVGIIFFLPGKNEKKGEIGLNRIEGTILIGLFIIWILVLIKLF